MFVLKPKPTFEAEVLIPIPGGDTGKLTLEFKHMGVKALQAFYASLGTGDNVRKDADALLDLVNGWKGADGPFSAEALEALLDDFPGSAKVIFDTYSKALFEGKRKNS